MTPAERRKLRRNIIEMRAQSRLHWHPYARQQAGRALAMLEHADAADPRPSWWLRVRLRLRGVRAG